MADALRLAGYREPLGLWTRRAAAPADYPELRAQGFEFSSRGDRVTGRLLLPPVGEGPYPLVLLQHGAGGSSRAPYVEATAGPWARRGLAVGSIDFPLHGPRADQKLAEQLPSSLLGSLEVVDPDRVAYAGFSLGAMIGAAFCGLDPRPRAAALALGGAGLGPSGADPGEYVGRMAPRPLLLVNALQDEVVPHSAAEALFEAAGDPKQQLWFEAPHDQLPGTALKAMWRFLADQLEVEPDPVG
jgi:cephalosporin-C deacetylase-like acetyl esterase